MIRKRCKCPMARRDACPHPWHLKIKHRNLRRPSNPTGVLRISLATYARTCADLAFAQQPVSGPGRKPCAEALARRIRQELDEGRFVRRPGRGAAGLTVADAYARYLQQHVMPQGLCWRPMHGFMGQVLDGPFQHRRLADVRHQDFVEILAAMQRHGLGASTIRTRMTRLKGFFLWCVDEDRRYLPRLPVHWKRLALPKDPGSRAQRIATDDLVRLRAGMAPWLRDLTDVMLHTVYARARCDVCAWSTIARTSRNCTWIRPA